MGQWLIALPKPAAMLLDCLTRSQTVFLIAPPSPQASNADCEYVVSGFACAPS